MNQRERKWCDPASPADLAGIYGPHWYTLPVVYGSLGMAGHDRDARFEEHEDIARALHPDFLFLSPYRGVGQSHYMETTTHLASPSVLNSRHALVRDFADVRRARVMLLNMAAPYEMRKVVRWVDGGIGVLDAGAVVTSAVAEVIGEAKLDVPLTGTIAEIVEAGRLQIPIIGFNDFKASRQMRNPFVRDYLTCTYNTWQQAVQYIKENWFM